MTGLKSGNNNHTQGLPCGNPRRAAESSAPRNRSISRGCGLSILLALLAPATGCMQYNWRNDFEAAEQQARAEGRHLFVFYKWWPDSDSNRMLGDEVLSAPEVVSLFQDTINVMVDRDFGPQFVAYVGKYGVTTVPSSIIVAPDGTYQVQRGFVPRDRFIEFATRAKTPRTEAGARSMLGVSQP